MADSTSVTDFNIGHFFNVSTVTNTVSATATFGIKITKAFVDKDGAVITGNFFLNILDPDNNKVERIYVPASGVSTDGLTIGVETTGEVTRGLKPTGNDVDNGSSTYSFKLRSGMIVAATMDPIIITEFQRALLAEISCKIKFGANPTFDAGISIAPNTYATVAARNADIPSPSDWLFAGVDDTGMTYYNPTTVQWETLGSETPTPTATNVVQGKVYKASVANQGAQTAGVYALMAENLVKTSSGAADENKVPVLNADGDIEDGFIPSTIGITGEIKLWSTASAPTGWLIANAAAVSRTTYAALFAVVGTTYGVGDGSTTFNLPDFRGRTPIGAGTGDAADATAHALADTEGTETHQLTENEMPSHTHDITLKGIGGSGGQSIYSYVTGDVAITSDSKGGDAAHNNLQPSLTINFIIKT